MTIVKYKFFGVTIFTKETMDALPLPELEKAVQDALLRVIKSADYHTPTVGGLTSERPANYHQRLEHERKRVSPENNLLKSEG